MCPRPVEPGSPAARVIDEEEKILANVLARLATSREDSSEVEDYDRELIEMRDAIAEAKPEDLAPLVEQMTRLQAIAARRGRSRALPVDPTSPYFAHIRLDEKGPKGQRLRDVLLGKRGFASRSGPGPALPIVDWRNAPVSRIYYRYEEGDDYDEAFDGHALEGVVVARRNLSIAAGRLRRIGCPEGTFVKDARGAWFQAEDDIRPTLQGGQGTAARPPRPAPVRKLGIHGGSVPRADKHLPEIAALIDKEQFELITHPTSGLVLIQGGAGSGKTTVALHRVAYLNFSDPQRFRPKKMLVVVPSHALSQYIAGVLPALGVAGVPVFTTAAWAQAMRKRLIPRSPDVLADDTPDGVALVKKHPVLLNVLEEFVAGQARGFERELAGDAVLEPVARQFAGEAARPLVPRFRAVLAWLEKAPLSPGARQHARTVLGRLRRRAADVVEDWAEILTDRELLGRAFSRTPVPEGYVLATLRRAAQQREDRSEYEGIDEDRLTTTDGRPLDSEDGGAPVGGRLDPEDLPLLIRLHQLKHGGLVDTHEQETRYEHLAIDEAQDLSAVQLKVLLEATTEQRCVTVAGDSAQRLVFDNGFVDWPSHLAAAGYRAEISRPLRLSYRSTAEVMRFSRRILGPLADPDEPLVARPGAPVELFRFGELGEAAAFLADALRSLVGREPTASAAVITRHPEQADAVHAALSRAEVPALRRVRREDFAFAPGVDVTDVAQVKGLEFDYVILMDVTAGNYPDALEARHLLHIAATRAAHQLWMVTTAEPSPLLPAEMLSELK